MKLNIKTFFAIISSVFMLIYTGAAVSAETLEVSNGKAAESHIGAGESESFSTKVHSEGFLSFTVDIDSTEGDIIVCDKHNKQIESVHYTSADMPVTLTVDSVKGIYTLEVTRDSSSEGTGDVTVSRGFALDKNRLNRKSTGIIIIISVIVCFGLTAGSKYRGSRKGSFYFKKGRAMVKDHLNKSVFKSIEDTGSNIDFFKRFF